MLVDGDNAPGGAFGPLAQVIQARDRAGVDREAEDALRFDPERDGERGPNGPAMDHGHDVAAGMLSGDARHRAADPRHHVLEALAAGRPLAGGRMPEPEIVG